MEAKRAHEEKPSASMNSVRPIPQMSGSPKVIRNNDERQKILNNCNKSNFYILFQFNR